MGSHHDGDVCRGPHHHVHAHFQRTELFELYGQSIQLHIQGVRLLYSGHAGRGQNLRRQQCQADLDHAG